jgi:sterol desaturase/sphingolipid hydroxylase (fatty acid hydroxylase superfamily)
MKSIQEDLAKIGWEVDQHFVNHNLHHQYFKGNYGLYFLFWDRMMGTIRNDYDERFEEVKSR